VVILLVEVVIWRFADNILLLFIIIIWTFLSHLQKLYEDVEAKYAAIRAAKEGAEGDDEWFSKL